METNRLISIVMATNLEAKPFLQNMTKIEKEPFTVYSSDKFILIISGIG
ncbi:MAG: phosphorylase, partial [Desulfobacterales bacterium]|nr:phosphorylase [Desulfobacterales bacterium]